MIFIIFTSKWIFSDENYSNASGESKATFIHKQRDGISQKQNLNTCAIA